MKSNPSAVFLPVVQIILGWLHCFSRMLQASNGHPQQNLIYWRHEHFTTENYRVRLMWRDLSQDHKLRLCFSDRKLYCHCEQSWNHGFEQWSSDMTGRNSWYRLCTGLRRTKLGGLMYSVLRFTSVEQDPVQASRDDVPVCVCMCVCVQ